MFQQTSIDQKWYKKSLLISCMQMTEILLYENHTLIYANGAVAGRVC